MMLEETPGYIMRIINDDWVTQVFELKKYYSGIIRKWRIGTPILFAKKTEVGDSFLGYGITDRVEMLWAIIHKSVVNSFVLTRAIWNCRGI